MDIVCGCGENFIMEKKDQPIFLSNIPLGEDLFEGKSQEKIANVLENVLSGKDFQIVGIDGGWGTGKSNLVFMLKKRLKSHAFFLYDVWGHQEDDQRRSILIELTDYLCDETTGLTTDKDKWRNKYKRLLAKEKEVTTINRPSLSIGFILSLVLIVYVPAIAAFAKDMPLGPMKYILVLFPLILIFFIFIWKFFKNFKDNTWVESTKKSVQETFQVYNNKQIDETKIETISENEPSVRDFRMWMKEIDADLVGKKLVLVFDNFDRLPKKHILSIWSSIHIFFSEEKYNNIKVIVPFDRSHIKNAFKESSENANDYANDYINKTFDLVYRVSPPIMSDWKIFFKNCWDKAFANSEEEEYLKVEQIYEVFRPSITPREIIAFINEVVSIRLLDSTVPERYIALFVLNKEIILINPLDAIVKADFLSGLAYLYKDDEDFQKYITALSYQIIPENALEVVYRKQLKESLMNGDKDQFITISQTNIFDKILSTVIAEIDNYEIPIKILSNLDDKARISAIHLSGIWHTIYLKVLPQVLKEFEFSQYQGLLLKKITDVQKSKYLQSIITGFYQNDDFESVNFAAVIKSIQIFLELESIEIDVYGLLEKKQVQVEEFMNLVKYHTDTYDKFLISCDNKLLNGKLIETPLEKIEETTFVEFIRNDYDLKVFTDFLEEKIPTNYNNSKNLSGILNVLKVATKSTFGVALSDDQIYSAFTALTVSDDLYYDLLAMRLARAATYSSSYSSSFSIQMESLDDELATKVSERIEYFVNYGDLLINSIKLNSPSPLYQSVVRKVIANDYQSNTADIRKLLEIFKDICTINKIDPQDFINDLTRWDLPVLDAGSVVKYPIFYFQEALKSETKLAKKTLELAKEYFDKLSTPEWKILFADLSVKDASLMVLLDYNNWNSFALDALKEHLVGIGASGILKDNEALLQLLNRFVGAGKDLSDSFKDLRDELISKRNMDVDLFRFFGQMLFDYANLQEKSSEVFRTILKSTLLDDKNCVTILVANSEVLKEMLLTNGGEFKEAISDRYDQDHIVSLAQKLEIKRRSEDMEIVKD